MKYLLATTAMLGILAGSIVPAAASNSNVEKALAGQSDLSLFYQALLNTGVASELNENTEYTIFAPTNVVFAEIQPRAYPCFYSAQCREGVAVVLRNHIVPRNESIQDFSKWGGDIPTIGNLRLNVEEPYKGEYTVEGHRVVFQSKGEYVSLYPIDGVIVSDQLLASFRTQPLASAPGTVTQKTVTTYRTQGAPPAVSGGYLVPGGYPAAPAVYVGSDELPDNTTQTTTVTHTTTTRTGE